MGQGLVGLMITALLRCAGARVMAVDIKSARPVSLALGAEKMVISSEQDLGAEIRAWTSGYGVDAAIICTSGASNLPIEQAADALRDRGRLVDVGIAQIELPWQIFYERNWKCASPDPGRDGTILSTEWGGADYPIGYVRWTEQRNFSACLQLMASGHLDLRPLTTARVSFNQALGTYERLLLDGAAEIGVVLEYGSSQELAGSEPGPAKVSGKVRTETFAAPIDCLDVIGAGNFARSMLLPHLKGKIKFGKVVNQTALSANHAKTKFGFANAGTDFAEAVGSSPKSALLIATRHRLHAPLA